MLACFRSMSCGLQVLMRCGATSVSNKHVQPLPSTFNDAHLGLRNRRTNPDLPQGMTINKLAGGRITVYLQASIMGQQVTVTRESHLPKHECRWTQPKLNGSRASTIAAAMKGYELIVSKRWDEKPDWLKEAGWQMVRLGPCMSYTQAPMHPSEVHITTMLFICTDTVFFHCI